MLFNSKFIKVQAFMLEIMWNDLYRFVEKNEKSDWEQFRKCKTFEIYSV